MMDNWDRCGWEQCTRTASPSTLVWHLLRGLSRTTHRGICFWKRLCRWKGQDDDVMSDDCIYWKSQLMVTEQSVHSPWEQLQESGGRLSIELLLNAAHLGRSLLLKRGIWLGLAWHWKNVTAPRQWYCQHLVTNISSDWKSCVHKWYS